MAQGFGRDRLRRSLVCCRLDQGGLGTTSSTPPVACLLAVSAIEIGYTRESIGQPIARPKRPCSAVRQPGTSPTRPTRQPSSRMLALGTPSTLSIGGRHLHQDAAQLAARRAAEEPSPGRLVKRPPFNRYGQYTAIRTWQLDFKQIQPLSRAKHCTSRIVFQRHWSWWGRPRR
jgi:hypothetical protein